MAGKDYYATLGVANTASEDELKKGRLPGISAPMRSNSCCSTGRAGVCCCCC